MFFVWFDPDPHKPTAQKIAEAAARYGQKHGYPPKVCLISSSLDPQEYAGVGDIAVVAFKHTRPGYFWLAQSESGDLPTTIGDNRLPQIETEAGTVHDATPRRDRRPTHHPPQQAR